MTDPTTILPLLLIEDKDGAREDWSQFLTPQELFGYIANNFGVDPTRLNQLQKFVISAEQPDFDTIWVYVGTPSFIGVPIEGRFVKFYRYPPDSPFISINPNITQEGVRLVSEAERLAWNLPEVTSPAFWAILTEVIT